MAPTFTVGKADGKRLSLGLTLADIGRSVPNPATVATNIGRELHVRDDCLLLASVPLLL